MPTSRRLFIGLMASPAVQKAVSLHQMQWEWPAQVRLVPPEKMHLTLLFLGNVEEGDELRLRAALADVPMTSPVYLRLCAADTFPGGIAVLRVEENRALEMLQGDLAAVVHSLGLATDTQPWRPHLTIARNALGCVPPPDAPAIEWDAVQFSLVCSRPERAHSYEVLQSWPVETVPA